MITIEKPGMQMSIQDQGRTGSRHLGVSQAGCLDPVAQIVANRLVGNPDNNPVIEITFGLAEIAFNNDYLIALHGTDMQASIDGHAIRPGWCCYIKKGQRLTLAAARHGFRSYLAIAGNWQLTQVLGSYATDLAAGFGGLSGAALQAGDEINITPHYDATVGLGAMLPAKRTQIRVHPGPHNHLLNNDQLEQFTGHSWQVTNKSNRMGLRLASNECTLSHELSLPSLAVMPGSIQLPPNGEPIVLLNDAQTTGGYPLLGTVIDADLRHFAQLKPSDFINFEFVSIAAANAAADKTQAHLNQLQIALNYKNKA
ncbi:biotin-dependent carboxyltransferase family protein [Pseudoalteromonas mariniglutinosa]|uniref:5-oxoprolinase subunit C family protein n=1 Tax=Pseudoalteromonas mariniglutinosa TaxID=206042 RepID=UPI003850D36B